MLRRLEGKDTAARFCARFGVSEGLQLAAMGRPSSFFLDGAEPWEQEEFDKGWRDCCEKMDSRKDVKR